MDRLAAVLIAAHVLGDFALQPDGLVRRKDRLIYLLLHTDRPPGAWRVEPGTDRGS